MEMDSSDGSRDHVGPRLTVLYAMKYHLPAPWRFNPTTMPYSMARLVIAGAGMFVVDGERHAVATGAIMLVPEGTVLECYSSSTDFAFISVRFTSSIRVDGRDLVAEMLAIPVVSPPQHSTDLTMHFEALVDVWLRPTPARNLLAVGHLHIILGTLLANSAVDPRQLSRRTAPRQGFTARVQDPRIERAMDHLASNERRTPDVRELCALTHMSESTLRRSFKEHTGKTIGDYVRDIRMSSAAHKLLLTDDNIAEVALELGFADSNYFTRVFRAVFGMSPTRYRHQARLG